MAELLRDRMYYAVRLESAAAAVCAFPLLLAGLTLNGFPSVVPVVLGVPHLWLRVPWVIPLALTAFSLSRRRRYGACLVLGALQVLWLPVGLLFPGKIQETLGIDLFIAGSGAFLLLALRSRGTRDAFAAVPEPVRAAVIRPPRDASALLNPLAFVYLLLAVALAAPIITFASVAFPLLVIGAFLVRAAGIGEQASEGFFNHLIWLMSDGHALLIACASLMLLLSYRLHTRTRRGWCVALAIASMALFPAGTILGAAALWTLSRPAAREPFGHPQLAESANDSMSAWTWDAEMLGLAAFCVLLAICYHAVVYMSLWPGDRIRLMGVSMVVGMLATASGGIGAFYGFRMLLLKRPLAFVLGCLVAGSTFILVHVVGAHIEHVIGFIELG